MPEIPDRELLQLATPEGAKGLFFGCSLSRMADHFTSAGTIQFVSTNLAILFEQIGVSARVIKLSDSSRHKRRILISPKWYEERGSA